MRSGKPTKRRMITSLLEQEKSISAQERAVVSLTHGIDSVAATYCPLQYEPNESKLHSRSSIEEQSSYAMKQSPRQFRQYNICKTKSARSTQISSFRVQPTLSTEHVAHAASSRTHLGASIAATIAACASSYRVVAAPLSLDASSVTSSGKSVGASNTYSVNATNASRCFKR